MLGTSTLSVVLIFDCRIVLMVWYFVFSILSLVRPVKEISKGMKITSIIEQDRGEEQWK
jgi:hypothetical protein